MVQFKEQWASSFQASAITSGSSETFGANESTQTKKDKWGSANSLILSSLSDEDFEVRLDGLDSRLIGILYTRGALIIKPEDGIYFNSVKLTNVSGTDSSDDEINVRIARAVPLVS